MNDFRPKTEEELLTTYKEYFKNNANKYISPRHISSYGMCEQLKRRENEDYEDWRKRQKVLKIMKNM